MQPRILLVASRSEHGGKAVLRKSSHARKLRRTIADLGYYVVRVDGPSRLVADAVMEHTKK
jgi:hypothetical protein